MDDRSSVMSRDKLRTLPNRYIVPIAEDQERPGGRWMTAPQ
jgi:hypothetical protein